MNDRKKPLSLAELKLRREHVHTLWATHQFNVNDIAGFLNISPEEAEKELRAVKRAMHPKQRLTLARKKSPRPKPRRRQLR